jgi:Zn-finger nucleic acid-binding protein
MRTYERNGVNVDQCTGCKGIFLDRGELEALINAESDFAGPAAPAVPAAQQRSSEPYYPPQNNQQPYRKKKSFLSEFLDFD